MAEETRQPQRRRALLMAVGAVLAVLAVAAIVVAITGGFSGELVYRNSSEGMAPTMKRGETFGVIRGQHPRLGEILVFHPPATVAGVAAACADSAEGEGHREACAAPAPHASEQVYVKRVVGMPGDRVAVVGGHVLRNGVREPDGYITPCGGDAAVCDFPQAITIPAGTYFVLGDNRGASFDSRFWGPVRRAWIIGTVVR